MLGRCWDCIGIHGRLRMDLMDLGGCIGHDWLRSDGRRRNMNFRDGREGIATAAAWYHHRRGSSNGVVARLSLLPSRRGRRRGQPMPPCNRRNCSGQLFNLWHRCTHIGIVGTCRRRVRSNALHLLLK